MKRTGIMLFYFFVLCGVLAAIAARFPHAFWMGCKILGCLWLLGIPASFFVGRLIAAGNRRRFYGR